MDKILDIEIVKQIIEFVKYAFTNLGWFIFVPVGGALLIMFFLNLILKKVDKANTNLDLATLRKSFEFIISFPLAFGIYCLTAVCLKLNTPFVEQVIPGLIVLGVVVQTLYVIINRVILALFKFVINSVKKATRKDK